MIRYDMLIRDGSAIICPRSAIASNMLPELPVLPGRHLFHSVHHFVPLQRMSGHVRGSAILLHSHVDP